MKNRKPISVDDIRFRAQEALASGDVKKLESTLDAMGISSRGIDQAREKLVQLIQRAHLVHSELSANVGEAAAALVEAAQAARGEA